jgi:hypothetical protein
MKKEVFYNGTRYKVINTYISPFYGEFKVQFYVDNILHSMEAKELPGFYMVGYISGFVA